MVYIDISTTLDDVIEDIVNSPHVTYQDLIEAVELMDDLIGDSVFTDMLKSTVDRMAELTGFEDDSDV
jgi:hypothetical protein